MAAKDVRAFRDLSNKLTACEERTRLLDNLVKAKVGLREVEEYIRKEKDKLRGEGNYKPGEQIVMGVMKAKFRDNISFGIRLRRQRTQIRKKLERTLGEDSNQMRKILKECKDNRTTLRKKLRKKNVRKCSTGAKSNAAHQIFAESCP